MLTLQQLKKRLAYDPATGVFVWLTGPRSGQVAGCLDPRGYCQIYTGGRNYWAHRLAWLYVNGVWPKKLDHKNQNKSDNRISNLREATQSQNMLNISSPDRGVYFHKASKKWMAAIRINGKSVHLGLFAEKTDALKARRSAEIFYCGEFAPVYPS